MTNKNPCTIIKLDKHTGKIERPALLLKSRAFEVIGKISHYDRWHISMKANAIDEISFEVHKYANGIKCPVWDELTDLKIVDVVGYGQFEIHCDYTDGTETVKSIVGQSLEVELGQVILHGLHVNDEESTDTAPTVFYNAADPEHSLLHRVLADKAPHWSIGSVPEYVTRDDSKGTIAEEASAFQRTYTVDGTSVYDFLTGEVAQETNVVFVFNTYARIINVYSIYDCYNENGDLLVESIGEDTNILISKQKLANEIGISSNADAVKNCFRISGGDDLITDMVAAVNLSGNNYIYQFADFQLNDMPKELSDKLLSYQANLDDYADEYYGENGIYTELCKKYEEISELESGRMPDVEFEEPTVEEQYTRVIADLTALPHGVGISSYKPYKPDNHLGVDNNVVALAEVYAGTLFKVELVSDTASYWYAETEKCWKWKGVLRLRRLSDASKVYPELPSDSPTPENFYITLSVSEDDENTLSLPYTEQKLYKELNRASMYDIESNIADKSEPEIREYFSQYSLHRLKGFADGYASCINVLRKLDRTNQIQEDGTIIPSELQQKYQLRHDIVEGLANSLQAEIDALNDSIKLLENKQENFQKGLDLETYLGDELYHIFSSYRREDEYNNSNYISDGLETSTDMLLVKAKELLDAARQEIRRSCVLQRTVTTSMNNLLILPEFEYLYDKFALFNYIRVKSDDELFKLRLLSIEFDDDNIQDIQVEFSENIQSLGDSIAETVHDTASLLQQASSIATSYSSVAKRAEQGNKAQNAFKELSTKGLNTSNIMLRNSDDNEVTYDSHGILCKRMDDQGIYGDKQLRLIGNGIYLTDDAWQTVRMAIGEIYVQDPINDALSDWQYGVIADALIGKLIAGERMYIGNSGGTVQITGEGIDITGGKIELENTRNKVSINPATSNIFSITKATDGSNIFSVDEEGNGSFSGKVTATSGLIGGWSITPSAIQSGAKSTGIARLANINDNMMNVIAIGIGSDTVSGFNDCPFRVTKTGKMYATDANLTGTIHATGGTFSNTIKCDGRIIGGEFNGATIIGGDGIFTKGFKVDLSSKNPSTNISSHSILMQRNGFFVVENTVGDKTSSLVLEGNRTHIESDTVHINTYKFGLIGDSDIQGSMVLNGALDVKSSAIIDGNLKANGGLTAGTINADISEFGTIHLVSGEGDKFPSYINKNSLSLSNLSLGVTGPNAIASSTENLAFANATNQMIGFFTKAFRPYGGNTETINLGGSANRWGQIYTTTSVSVESDRNLKNSIETFTPQHEAFFHSLKPVTYKFNNRVRTHYGFISQDVRDSLFNNGFTDLDFGGYCRDAKTKEVETDGEVHEISVLDENGEPEYIYSLRYEEFIALNTHMIQKSRKEIQELREEITRLKASLDRKEN